MNQQNISDIITVLKHLSEHHYKCFTDRRSYHWKINFFLWGGIFALSAGLINNNIFIPLCLSVSIAIILFFIYVGVWMRGLKKAHAINKKYYECYNKILHKQLKNEDISIILPTYNQILREVTCFKNEGDWKGCFPKAKIWFDWSSVTEITITILILLGSIFLLRDP